MPLRVFTPTDSTGRLIRWYVDGEPVYKATDNIPSTPGKIMMNTWPGTGVDEWLNHYNGNTPLTARYQWVTYDKK